MKKTIHKISTLSLILLITGAIDSIRNLPTTALFGSSLIFFFIFSALIFLIPVALVSAELSACWADEEGGIYHWVNLAFDKNIAFIAIWLQWINTLVWYPTILSFIAGTMTYLYNPALAENKAYLLVMIVSVFWGLTLLNLRGLRTSARFASICTILGMIIPMVFIIGLALIWIFQGKPIQVHFTLNSLLPDWKNSQSWVSLTAIMTAFLGIELAAVHIKQIDSPQIKFPKAMFFSVILILSTMILGSLSIAFVLPHDDINLVSGVMQAFKNFLSAYQLQWLLPIIVIMLLLGSIGGLVNWIISPARGLLQASQHGFLSPFLAHTNRYGVPSRLLILQAVIVTILGLAFLIVPSVNGIYWLFTDLSTELYMAMYVLLFLAAIKLKRKYPTKKRPFAIPGGNSGYYFTCLLGLVGCFITLIVGFIPPQLNGSASTEQHFQLIFSCGVVVMLLPAFFILLHKKLKPHKLSGN